MMKICNIFFDACCDVHYNHANFKLFHLYVDKQKINCIRRKIEPNNMVWRSN